MRKQHQIKLFFHHFGNLIGKQFQVFDILGKISDVNSILVRNFAQRLPESPLLIKEHGISRMIKIVKQLVILAEKFAKTMHENKRFFWLFRNRTVCLKLFSVIAVKRKIRDVFFNPRLDFLLHKTFTVLVFERNHPYFVQIIYPFQSIFSKLKLKNSFQRKLYYGIRLF